MMSFDLEPASFAASASAMELGGTVSLDYRGADTQLVWWGKLSPSASQPSLQKLGVSLGAYIYKIPSFSSLENLFNFELRLGWIFKFLAAFQELEA